MLINFFLIVVFLFFLVECRVFSQHSHKEIVIGLEWQFNIHHALLLVAKAAGYFKEEDLCVSFVTTGGNQDSCKLVNAKKLAFAITSQPQLYVHTEQGFTLQSVATLLRIPLIIDAWFFSSLKIIQLGMCRASVLSVVSFAT